MAWREKGLTLTFFQEARLACGRAGLRVGLDPSWPEAVVDAPYEDIINNCRSLHSQGMDDVMKWTHSSRDTYAGSRNPDP